MPRCTGNRGGSNRIKPSRGNNMHCVNGSRGRTLVSASLVRSRPDDNDMRSRKDSSTVRSVCWERAGRSRGLYVARGRPPRNANTRARAYICGGVALCIARHQTCTRSRGECVSFYPACFRARIVTNKRATRKRDCIARNNMTVIWARFSLEHTAANVTSCLASFQENALNKPWSQQCFISRKRIKNKNFRDCSFGEKYSKCLPHLKS